MPTEIKLTRSLLSYALKSVFSGSSNYMLLIDPTATIDETQTKTQIVSAELTTTGYSRINIQWLDNQFGSYDPIDGRHETDQIQVDVAAGSNILQYAQIAVLLGASPDRPKSFTNADINTSTNKIAIANHGLVNGEELVITTEGVSLPTPLQANTLYYAMQVTTNDFAISSDGINVLDITSTGSSATLWLKKAKGEKALIISELSSTNVLTPITLQPSQTQTYNIFLAAQDDGRS